jgi:hypothetical protein
VNCADKCTVGKANCTTEGIPPYSQYFDVLN